MQPIISNLLLVSLLAVGSCKSKADPQPTIGDADVLMQANGYWEWVKSASLGGLLTPASVGFSRELIFKNDGFVHIFHNRQAAIQRIKPVWPANFRAAGALRR